MQLSSRTLGIVLFITLLGLPGISIADSAAARPGGAFPEPAMLRPAVNYWKRIFTHYSKYQSLVQSSLAPQTLLKVLDFRDAAGEMNPGAYQRYRQKVETRAAKRFDAVLRGIVAAGADPHKMNAEQRHVYDLYGGGDSKRFKAMIGTLRSQHGLRERTEHAFQVAGRYLPKMRQIFAAYDLPKRLAWLPLVESSFNLDAYSKVGAAGIWQFMPATARIYMKLDAVQDERRDPWVSTDAAARHLRDDYAALGSWPLALTAYNYGRSGLAQALQQVQGTTLVDLLKRYDNPRFGFASRNFYAEFLAATQVAADPSHYFGTIEHDAPIRFDVVKTRDYVSYRTLQRLSGVSASTFRILNPSFYESVVKGRLYVPPGTKIRIARGDKRHFYTRYASLSARDLHSHQRVWYVAYRVRRGDVLGRIAHRHHVSVATLRRYNHLRHSGLIRVGQVLRIPTRGALREATYTRLVRHDARRPQVIHHRVRSGETLSGIASRYHVSVAALQRRNHLRHVGSIRVGQVLRVPVVREQHVDRVIHTVSRKSRIRHRVRSGQTLSGIAAHYHVSVAALRRYNHLRHSSLLHVGQKLRIPAASTRTAAYRVVVHRVRSGQTLSGIAARFNSSVAAIRRLNDMHDADQLAAGRVLKIPVSG